MPDDPFDRAVRRAAAISKVNREEERPRRGRRLNHTAFRIHASTFVAVQLLILAIWAVNGEGYPWFIYPLLGWGIGLAAHFATLSRSRE